MITVWSKYLYSGSSYICKIGLTMIENILKRRNKKLRAINEILLYGGGESEEETKQIGLINLFCICYIILRATRSLDVCVPQLVSDTLARRLITAQLKSKLKVRIIIHKSKKFHKLQQFVQSGIEVKIISPVVPLSYEFLLIDAASVTDNSIAVMGALDYDTTRINCNHDATIITSEYAVVNGLKAEFDRVWNANPVTEIFKNT